MNPITHVIQHEQKQDWLFTIDLKGQPKGSLRLIDFQWQEAISALYQGTASIGSRHFNLQLSDCIDKRVSLCVTHKYHGEKRYFHGIVDINRFKSIFS